MKYQNLYHPVKTKECEVVIWTDNFQYAHRYSFDSLFEKQDSVYWLYACLFYWHNEYYNNPELFAEYSPLSFDNVQKGLNDIHDAVNADYVMWSPSWKVDILIPKVKANPSQYKAIIDELTPLGKNYNEINPQMTFACGFSFNDKTGDPIFHDPDFGMMPDSVKQLIRQNAEVLRKIK